VTLHTRVETEEAYHIRLKLQGDLREDLIVSVGTSSEHWLGTPVLQSILWKL